jgi:hypothetical protein
MHIYVGKYKLFFSLEVKLHFSEYLYDANQIYILKYFVTVYMMNWGKQLWIKGVTDT